MADETPYVEVHRDQLDFETLAKYRVPWYLDQAKPDHILVKGDLGLITELLNHSRRLQELRHRDAALFVDCEHQYFTGPTDRKAPYTSFCVLDPVITVERHGEHVHIAARFNIETTILRYHSRKSDHHEMFFHDICLQYLHNSAKEVLVMSPDSDPSAAFTVTRSSNTTVSGQAGIALSQVPSANVSLGLSRSTGLTVQYAVSAWSVSAHRVVDNPQHEHERPLYQWFWAGTQEDTQKLTPDLKHTVKRHVVVKRIVPARGFPFNGTENELHGKEETPKGSGTVAWEKPRNPANGEKERAGNEKGKEREPKAASQVLESVKEETPLPLPKDGKGDSVTRSERLLEALTRCFKFSFCMKIRVNRRYGRLHRLLLLSTNELKSGLLKPAYEQKFHIQPDSRWLKELLEEGTRGKGHKYEGRKDEGRKDEGEKDEGRKDEGEKDEGRKDEGEKNGGEKDEREKDEREKDEGEKDEGEKDEGEKGDKRENPGNGKGAGGSFELPLGETIDITEELERMKKENEGNWDQLQGKPLADIVGRQSFQTLEGWREMQEQRRKWELMKAIERMEREERERRERDLMERMEEIEERRERKEGERRMERMERESRRFQFEPEEPHYRVQTRKMG